MNDGDLLKTAQYSHRIKRRFGDFDVDCVSRKELVNWCIADIEAKNSVPKIIMDVNGHALSLARRNEDYRYQIKQADIIHADGGFLVSLSKRLPGADIPERSATTDMIHDFARAFERTNYSFFLLGGTEEVNKGCAQELQRLYPGLKIAGRRNGYFSESEENDIIEQIKDSEAHVVWVGLGKPKEQEISLRWKHSLTTAHWIVTCGGCFNYVTGHYKRAPQWMQDRNLEWLHRLWHNPRQLLGRYLITNPHALWIAFRG
jgi:exopolysaccharide biosynthesis WecB/TagA/CpsF family protein